MSEEQSFQSTEDQGTGTASLSDPQATPATTNDQQSAGFEYNGRTMSESDIVTKFENADKHIETLEAERKKDRERVEALVAELEKTKESKATMDELMERMNGQGANADENSIDPKSVDLDKISERAAEQAWARMTQREKENQKKANLSEISGKLQEKYGDAVDSTVFGLMEELGYSRQEAFDLAGERPKAFLRMIGFEDKPQNGSPTPTKGEFRNSPAASDAANAPDKLIGAKDTKSRVAAWDARIQSKLKQLGINT